MARVVTDSQHYTDIVNALNTLRQNKSGEFMVVGQLKPSEIAEFIELVGNEVYDNGYYLGELNSMLDPYTNSNLTEIPNHTYNGCNAFWSVEFPNVTSIGSYAFNGCSKLGDVYFPLATSIGSYAFNNCGIVDANFPVATGISGYAFNNCKKLTGANFPLVTSIGSYSFAGCSMLSSLEFPLVTSVGQYAFHNCNKLTNISMPKCDSFSGTYNFYNCTSVTKMSFPELVTAANYCFQNCNKMTELYVPKLKTAKNSWLFQCTSLKILDLPSVTSIDYYGLRCQNLEAVILRNNAVATLHATPASTQDSFRKGTCYVYVPAALVDTYKASTNWSTYASQIRTLEDYTVDGTTTGALDESKI